MHLLINTSLDYDVFAPTTMILNIEAMGSPQQKLLRSVFAVDPFVPADLHKAFESANAYRRLVLPVGHYRISFEGEVDSSATYADPAMVGEVPVAQLPFEALPYLYPSRYCQSDRLARFAIREFGRLPTGHERVAAICNWI